MATPNSTDLKNKAQDTLDKGREFGKEAMDKGKEFGQNVADKAKSMASDVADSARHMASGAGQAAENATSRLGEGVSSLAGQVRDHGPHGGTFGSATEAVASTLDRGGRYLQDEGLSGMADDVTQMIRKNPIPALFIALGVGFLLARVTRS